jgi:predicted Zn-dependent protease
MLSTSKAISKFRRYLTAALCTLVAFLLSTAGGARAQGLPLIRDAEIEALLQDYAKPIFQAAGFGSGRVTVRIVNNDSFNAFVLDGANVFVHTGTLMQAKTPNEVIGVIAHESGHIAGGHMAALRARIAKDQTRALLAQVLGLGAMVAGGVSGGTNGRETMQGGQAIMQGGTNIIMKGLLAERRSQESAADQAGLKYLTATKQSGRGMLDTFERFKQQEYLSEDMQDPFIRSHPLSVERLARLSALVAASPYVNKKDPPSLQLRHDLMRAKLSGYLESPATVFNRYPASDKSLPGRYARAIATFFRGGPGALESSLKQIDGMIHENPAYPYFYELKADLLMRSGNANDAIPDLRQALKLAPGSPLIQVELANALQDNNDEADLKESITLLRKSLIVDENGKAYRLLANAYYKQGKGPEADAMTAQAYFYEGNVKQAQIFAKRAQSHLHAGSPEWLKTGDIINYKPQT